MLLIVLLSSFIYLFILLELYKNFVSIISKKKSAKTAARVESSKLQFCLRFYVQYYNMGFFVLSRNNQPNHN